MPARKKAEVLTMQSLLGTCLLQLQKDSPKIVKNRSNIPGITEHGLKVVIPIHWWIEPQFVVSDW